MVKKAIKVKGGFSKSTSSSKSSHSSKSGKSSKSSSSKSSKSAKLTDSNASKASKESKGLRGSKNVYKRIMEGESEILVPANAEKGNISKELPVFYNPLMELNRTLSVIAIKIFSQTYRKEKPKLTVFLPLAGTGVRGIRFLKERGPQIEKVLFNDLNPTAVKIIEKNLKHNKIPKSKFSLSMQDANVFMLTNRSADYIDIDPFGSPNPFLDAAMKRMKTPGLLGITATDTASLCGTYPSAGRRKYWANPVHGAEMHELGLRILIRKVQLVGAQYEKALTPLVSYAKDHYMRVMFLCEKSKSKTDNILKQHVLVGSAGPLWERSLQLSSFVHKMRMISEGKVSGFLKLLEEENKVDRVGLFDLHRMSKELKISVPRMVDVIENLKKMGFKSERSHSNLDGIKSDAEESVVKETLKKLNSKIRKIKNP